MLWPSYFQRPLDYEMDSTRNRDLELQAPTANPVRERHILVILISLQHRLTCPAIARVQCCQNRTAISKAMTSSLEIWARFAEQTVYPRRPLCARKFELWLVRGYRVRASSPPAKSEDRRQIMMCFLPRSSSIFGCRLRFPRLLPSITTFASRTLRLYCIHSLHSLLSPALNFALQ